jgi:hypothetical protein
MTFLAILAIGQTGRSPAPKHTQEQDHNGRAQGEARDELWQLGVGGRSRGLAHEKSEQQKQNDQAGR